MVQQEPDLRVLIETKLLENGAVHELTVQLDRESPNPQAMPVGIVRSDSRWSIATIA